MERQPRPPARRCTCAIFIRQTGPSPCTDVPTPNMPSGQTNNEEEQSEDGDDRQLKLEAPGDRQAEFTQPDQKSGEDDKTGNNTDQEKQAILQRGPHPCGRSRQISGP